MTEDAEPRQRKHWRLWLVLAAVLVLLAVLIVPPLVSINRYKTQITSLMAASLGRPVRLSSVELRVLPRPGFVLTDLSVEEDPAYGAEPILHANTVTASFRLLSLWRGRLEIGRISVDEASLNLVRTEAGRWNLDSLFRTAAAKTGSAQDSAGRRRAVPLPFLEATHSRINIKSGAEKLPYSLIDTELSFWQQEPGDWRIELRGQPARTDVSLQQADTGIVRLEGSVRRAPELHQMPVHLDVDWREAQLGQLTRLVIGSDPGWRGDLTGELHLDGTADAAQVKTRLRATGVHRAEFAPAAPMDFDANCGFVYHYSSRAVNNLACDSPLGDGRIHIAGDLPGEGEKPRITVELDRIPVAAVLDALRTVRSGFGPGLEAGGAISGKIAYDQNATKKSAPGGGAKTHSATSAAQGPFTGSLTVNGFQLSGDVLQAPIHIPKVVLEPVAGLKTQHSGQAQPPALAATVAVPSGGTIPLTVATRLALSGYRVTVHGQAALARAREMAHVVGLANAAAMDALAGEPVAVDLSAEGPWMPAPSIPLSSIAPAGNRKKTSAAPPAVEAGIPVSDSLSGTVLLHNTNWKSDYLVNHVVITTATLHLGGSETRWDPVVFSYGPVEGKASLSIPASCNPLQPCLPQFKVEFGDLDVSVLQAAILGAHERGTMISALIDRLRKMNQSAAPVWPRLQGTVKADSLIVGPVTLLKPSAKLFILPAGAEISGLNAGLLGGRVQVDGTLSTGDKPFYSLQAHFVKLNPAAVGQLLRQRWSGGVFSGNGQLDLSGFTDKELAASAKGTLHFDWRHGAIAAASGSVPPQLARFDRWNSDAEITKGAITLKQSQVLEGARKRAVEATVTFGDPPKLAFAGTKETHLKKR
jgi:AsmA family